MYLCMYASIHIYLSIYLCVYIYTSFLFIYLAVFLSTYLPCHFSVDLLIDPPIRLSIYPSVCLSPIFALSSYLPTYLSTYFLGIVYHYLVLLSNRFQPSFFLSSNLPVFSVLVMHPCFHQDFNVHLSVVCMCLLIYADIFVCLCIEVMHCNAS